MRKVDLSGGEMHGILVLRDAFPCLEPNMMRQVIITLEQVQHTTAENFDHLVYKRTAFYAL
jgi:hypothetical protein